MRKVLTKFKKNIIITLIIIISFSYSCRIFAQVNKIYTPLEIQKAYKNKTRIIDGNPGSNYWQNKAEYKITAEIDTSKSSLFGSEEIIYWNNSPDTLHQLIIRLYPDFYKKGNARDFDIPEDDVGDGTNISFLSIDGIEHHRIDTLSRNTTNLTIPLTAKLLPGKNVKLKINWDYKFSGNPYREGKYPDNSYFAGYWYPQIAVYDDIDGWDNFCWKGIIEFYDDFSDFDVNITIPCEYIVWATGTLQNPEEVLSAKYLEKYKKALKSDEIVHIINAEDRKNSGITIKKGKNIWHYKAENILDFSFATSVHHLWDMTSLIVDKKSESRIIVAAAFKSDTSFYRKSAELGKKTIDYLSSELPGIPYPFPSFTIFEGSGDTEYPMMTNVGEYKNMEWLNIHSLSHEITHSYFPFYMGLNERKYACMDEGLAQMIPMAFQTREISKVRKNYDSRRKNNRDYEESAGREMIDHPPAVLSINMDFNSWHNVNYDRPGAAYLYLQDMLGEKLFKEALQEFMARWNHKHPTLYDFFNTFNSVTGEDLSWYWSPWFFQFGCPDLAIKNVNVTGQKPQIEIEKKGIIPIPIKLTITYSDNSTDTIYKTTRVWQNNNSNYSISLDTNKEIEKIELGDSIIPDVDRENNIWEKKP